MSYLYLGIRYLKSEKKRAVLTVIGLALVATAMYSITWAAFSLMDHSINESRREIGFDVALKSSDEELARKLIEDPRVAGLKIGSNARISSYTGPNQLTDDPEKWDHTTLLFVKLKHPRQMVKYAEWITETYGVETVWNYDYLSESNGALLLHTVAALFCFIFSIAGVAMVRNSIQLSTLKQIRDYGNLRCIGATKKQLREILFIQGITECTIGLLLGMVLSLILTGIVNAFLRNTMKYVFLNDPNAEIFQIRVLILPLLYVTFAFYFDLYFILKENMKSVYGMSPAQAISGQYRFLNKKIKPRRALLIRKFLGIEGEYAYKNLMRNPSRVWKNVGILSIAVAFITTVLMGIGGHFNSLLSMQDQYPYYQICLDTSFSTTGYSKYLHDITLERNILSLSDPADFPKEEAERITSSPYVTKASPLYQKRLLTSLSYTEHMNPYAEEHSYVGAFLNNEKHRDNIKLSNSWDFRGYTEEDAEIYGNALAEGTMKVSDHGIILINGAIGDYYSQTDRNVDPYLFYRPFFEELTDLKLGDQVRVIDPIWIRSELDHWIESTYSDEALLQKQYQEEYPEAEIGDKLDPFQYNGFLRQICKDEFRALYQDAMDNGQYKTFEIEGILSEDLLYENTSASPVFLMPMDRYMAMTGDDEISGIAALNYHVSHPVLFAMESLFIRVHQMIRSGSVTMLGLDTSMSNYGYAIDVWIDVGSSVAGTFLLIFAVLFLFLFLSFFNIRNATKNSIFLRRKEFAQLFVIGCTNKTLARMLQYEGVISGSLAILFGFLLSFPSILFLKINYRNYLTDADLPLTWWIYPLAFAVAVLFIIGFYALSVGRQSKQMNITPANDLTTAGE